ncbi:MAG: glutamate--tRNA ligase [Bacteroidetes Order II. Incertae sedis bacterium]|nr:glutamate--tRNA ligase [Bacteroidetes Order II. bacterium]
MRVRFAPSPTGFLHIGGLRTALYNYLLAKRHNGQFILRIEDTDQARFVPEAEADILRSLAWAGLDFDEGPGKEAGHGPYYQSQRSEVYREYVQRLLDKGHAYYAFDSSVDLEHMRERLKTAENPLPKYDVVTRRHMRNSFSMSKEAVEAALQVGEPYVIRMALPAQTVVRFKDQIRGEVEIGTDQLDDQVLMKSDGLPTYHLANVVDDHLMGITHVVRGEEWLPSTPKHVLLYQFFGWEAPAFAHLPLILSPSGGKLSKRKAEEAGIPVSVKEYIEAGYEPDALLNFLALLGWSPGNDQEVFSLSALSAIFSLDRVGQSGVQFSMDKLRWFNAQYLRMRSPSELAERLQPYAAGRNLDLSALEAIAKMMQERIHFASEAIEQAPFLFAPPSRYEDKPLKKAWKMHTPELLTTFSEVLERETNFTAEHLDEVLHQFAESRQVGLGAVMLPVRLALTGAGGGPSLFEIMAFLGKTETINRISRASIQMPSQLSTGPVSGI